MSKVIGVVAVDSKYGIGNEGKLLPFPREDMLHFQSTVKDGVILCTGSTYNQMRKSLGEFFVYSRKPIYYVSAKRACSSGAYLLNIAKRHAASVDKDVYLCGGKRLYELLQSQVDEWVITVDENVYPSDCTLPWIESLFTDPSWNKEVIKELTPTVKVYKVIKNVDNIGVAVV